MEVKYSKDFLKDIKEIKDKKLQRKITDTVERLKKCSMLTEVSGVKILHGTSKYYRIRFGDYRLGFTCDKNEIILSRFLNRKEIYRHFP